ncbi:MAG TPA: circularly permuted type 2 ATP-grasp protein, partial [Pseudomonadales bacterium]|nr:circularly permuted type 2 ATP-grasp protein [Pseudomonadales bacterium]
MSISWRDYPVAGLHDELIGARGRVREPARRLCHHLRNLDDADLHERRAAAEAAIQVMGITFTVYSEQEGSIDRAWPFDIIPRVIARAEWQRIEAGLRQRVRALNRFIDDVYHEQRIVKDGVFPAEVL